MLRLLSVLMGLAVLVAAAAGIFWVFAPVDHYRSSIEAAVLKATGRQLLIDGPVHIIFVPGVALDLGPVKLIGPGGGDDIVRAANAVVEVEIFPLLSGTVRIASLTLTGADLVIDRRATPDPVAPARASNIAPLRLGDVRLVTSRIHLKDAQRDISFGAEDVRIVWPRDGSALSVAGMIELGGELFDVNASTEQPGILLAGEGRFPVTVSFEGPLAKGSLDGAIDLGAFAFEGQLNLTTPSARRILALYGVRVPGDRGLHSLSVSATLRAQPGQAQLRNAKFTLDSSTGGGALGLRLKGNRLAIAGTVSVDQVDTSTYAAFQEPANALGAHGWSEAAVDLSGLRAMDIDLQINARRAVVADIQLTGVDAELLCEGGVGTLSIARGTASAGAVSGQLAIDVTGAAPVLSADFSIAGFDAKGFFGAALGSGALAGRGDLVFKLKGEGTSEADLVRHLEGEVSLKVTNGALDGVDLSAIAHDIGAPGRGQAAGEQAATDLKSLSVSFAVSDGVARTGDLELEGADLTLTAQGAIGLPARTLKLRLVPHLNDGTFAMPFAALGPWDAPLFVADWQALRDMVAGGAVSVDDLTMLPESTRAWFADVVAGKAKLPDLPAVPGAPETDPEPEIVPAATP